MNCRSCNAESGVKRTTKTARTDIRERFCPACGDTWESTEKETPGTRRKATRPPPDGYPAATNSSPIAAPKQPDSGSVRFGGDKGGASGSVSDSEVSGSSQQSGSDSGQDPDPAVVRPDVLLKIWRLSRSARFGGFEWGGGTWITPDKLRDAAELISATVGAAPFVQRSMERFWDTVKSGSHPKARTCARQPAFAFGAWLAAFPGDVEEYLGVEHPPETNGTARGGNRMSAADAGAAFLKGGKP